MVKRFEELRDSNDAISDQEILTERNLLRKGAGLLYARGAKNHGDAASKSFAQSNNHLKSPHDTVEEQLDNLTNALREQNEGLLKLREMLGSITALALVGVLLTEKGKNRR